MLSKRHFQVLGPGFTALSQDTIPLLYPAFTQRLWVLPEVMPRESLCPRAGTMPVFPAFLAGDFPQGPSLYLCLLR